jgi:hypothetical protein
MFRKSLLADLQLSERLKATGLKQVLFDVIKYCFSGEPFLPPTYARATIDELVSPDHSLC